MFLVFAFVICIPSLVKCLLRSLAHYSMVFDFLWLTFKNSLSILGNIPLSDVLFAKILSKSVGCPVILLTLSFAEKFLILRKSPLSIIFNFFYGSCFWCWI